MMRKEAGPPGGRIAVTGATGWVGRAVCAWLAGQGWQVEALGRTPQPGPWDRFWSWDVSRDRPDSLAESLHGCRALVHAAGHAHRPVETLEEVKRFEAINAGGTRRVVALAEAAAISRLVYVSTIAVYDWRGPARPRGETDATDLRTAYARSKYVGEELVRASGRSFVIARLATVFGEGDPANFSRLATALRSGRFILPGRGAARKSVIPMGLTGEVLGRLAIHPLQPEGVVNVALPESPTLREICHGFQRACGFPLPRSVPLPLLRGLAVVGDAAARIRPSFPLTTVTLSKLTTSTWVEASRLQHLLPEVAFPSFEEALMPAAEYYRAL